MNTGLNSDAIGGSTPAAVPRHIAIIMDGNNRWAKRKGVSGPAGHRAGVEAVRSVLRACQNHGVEVSARDGRNVAPKFAPDPGDGHRHA